MTATRATNSITTIRKNTTITTTTVQTPLLVESAIRVVGRILETAVGFAMPNATSATS